MNFTGFMCSFLATLSVSSILFQAVRHILSRVPTLPTQHYFQKTGVVVFTYDSPSHPNLQIFFESSVQYNSTFNTKSLRKIAISLSPRDITLTGIILIGLATSDIKLKGLADKEIIPRALIVRDIIGKGLKLKVINDDVSHYETTQRQSSYLKGTE